MKNPILLALTLCLSFFSVAQDTATEFRGVWIASVENIDWPRRGQWDAGSQQAEFIRQIEMHYQNGMNAVIVQARPAADAFYPSPYEPWSQWLTGTQGKAPSPYYDPLEFTINEAHKRGMEYHAWINPYRANTSIGRASIASDHITRTHPEWFLEYGGKLYFDPGNKEAQAWVIEVVKDMVTRYDVDAIHMDDYFYPYKVPGREFPDWASYRKYGAGMSKADWRRSNVDTVIRQLSTVIHSIKPWVKFGVSPIGTWRTNYDELYANVLLWMKEGWVDYVAPQIYWEFTQPHAPFQQILDWWNENSYGRHIYAGLGIYRAGSNLAWKDKTQLPRQIEATRNAENIHGQIYFSGSSFDKNQFGWADLIRNHYYKEDAMVPDMPWLPKRPAIAGPCFPKIEAATSVQTADAGQ